MSDLQKLFKYINGTAIVAFFRIPSFPSALVFRALVSDYKSKSSALYIIVPSIFVIHLMNSAQILNATWVGILCAVVTISPLTKM